MMFYGVLNCSMLFFDGLCLKSILGFLLSERTSGVSPVIFRVVVPVDLEKETISSLQAQNCLKEIVAIS